MLDSGIISVKTGGAATSLEYSKALDEMMDKIKRGASLRPVLKPVKKVSGNYSYFLSGVGKICCLCRIIKHWFVDLVLLYVSINTYRLTASKVKTLFICS